MYVYKEKYTTIIVDFCAPRTHLDWFLREKHAWIVQGIQRRILCIKYHRSVVYFQNDVILS
jgi:hypothetical protein